MTALTTSDTPATSLEVRERLVDTLRLDLYGPWAGHALSTERLPGWVRPSNWYLTGFLIPSGMSPEKRGDADEDDDIDVVPELAGLGEESNEERKAAKKGFFPSSMGLSFLVPKEAQSLTVIVCWGDYTLMEIDGEDGKPLSVWQRRPEERTVPVTFTGAADPAVHDVPDSGGLQLHIVEKQISAQDLEQHIPQGTRSVSVFLVNSRAPDEDKPDAAYAFQAKIEVHSEFPFVPRPDMRGAQADDWDTTPILRNTPPATASRSNGNSLTTHAESSAARGSRMPRCKKQRPWQCRVSSCQWTPSGRCLMALPLRQNFGR
jgi:hypothetical protein